MHESLYPYYERELLFIRQSSQDFARRYPAAAGRLMLEADRVGDPHVERLIESFALLAGRIHHKLDDEFPELTDALLDVLYPHYLAPIPSMGVVQFELDPDRAQLPAGFTIPRHGRLKTRPIGDVSCRFRTSAETTLWPIRLAEARFSMPPFPPGFRTPPLTAAALRLRLQCLGGMSFPELTMDRLRFYLSGDIHVVAALYEALLLNATSIIIRPDGAGPDAPAIVLDPADCLAPAGFSRDEGLLPYPAHAFDGYRLLTEYFAFPSKFQFIDLSGLSAIGRAGSGKGVEILITFRAGTELLEQGVGPETLRLGCVPVVNLFEKTAEPIPLTQARHEYRIVPDVASPLGMEVYSVGSVTGTDLATGTTRDYLPFHAFRHGDSPDRDRAFYYASRTAGMREGDRGTDVSLTLVDLDFNPSEPAESTLVVKTLCTNRDLPNLLRRSGDRLVFELEAAAPLARIRTLRSPSPPIRPPARRGAFWRLVSHLNLNHLSLTGPDGGLAAFKEILRLYDFAGPEPGGPAASVNDQVIDGIVSIRTRDVVGRVAGEGGEVGYGRGTEITLEFDEPMYAGSGILAFANVLDRFFALYTTINSFTRLIARTRQGDGLYKTWPPRAGDHPLI